MSLLCRMLLCSWKNKTSWVFHWNRSRFSEVRRSNSWSCSNLAVNFVWSVSNFCAEMRRGTREPVFSGWARVLWYGVGSFICFRCMTQFNSASPYLVFFVSDVPSKNHENMTRLSESARFSFHNIAETSFVPRDSMWLGNTVVTRLWMGMWAILFGVIDLHWRQGLLSETLSGTDNCVHMYSNGDLMINYISCVTLRRLQAFS